MKQIYNFEGIRPPVLNEAALRTIRERRAIQRQTALLAATGVITAICVIIMAAIVRFSSPMLSALLTVYAYASVGGVIAIIFIFKRRSSSWQHR